MSKHEHHDCNCEEHTHNHGIDEMNTIVMTNEDGTESEFDVLGTMELNGKKYVALLPRNFFIYEYVEKAEGMELLDITDEKVMQEVGDKFEEIFSSEDDED